MLYGKTPDTTFAVEKMEKRRLREKNNKDHCIGKNIHKENPQGWKVRKRNRRTVWLDVRENSKRLVVNAEKEPTEWHALVGKVLKRVSQENHEFKGSLSYNFVLTMKAHVYNSCTWKVEAGELL